MSQYLIKSNDDDDSTTSLGSQIVTAIFVLMIAAIVNSVYETNVLIFDAWGDPFWRGVSFEALTTLWWIPTWAFGINVLFILYQKWAKGVGIFKKSPGDVLKVGFVVALLAGIFEELIFRWLLFLAAIAGIAFSNLIFCGLTEWLYTNIILVVANFGTGLLISDLLITHPGGWLVGAAIISTAAAFRSHHAYQGLLGWIDSWFFAMAMFYILFNHGILACMIAHFTFNMVAAITLAFMTMLFTDH